MSKAPGLSEISHWHTLESLHKALDQTYQHMLEVARADWQKLFAGHDAADTCISVRISMDEFADELAGQPRAGFIPLKGPLMKGTTNNPDRRKK